jgi:DNA-binding MarR family transcriptional regulator
MLQAMNDSADNAIAKGSACRADSAGPPFVVPRCAEGNVALMLTFIGTAIDEVADDRLAPAGLTAREYTILAILDKDGPGSQAELARMLNKVPAMVVQAVDALESRGLVERTRDPADRRRSRVTMTAAGEQALAKGNKVADETARELLPGLDDAELKRLERLLSRGLGF